MNEHVFVAREREMARLEAMLARALVGEAQIGFIIGEAGAGKTTLLQEFVQQAEDAHPDLVVAVGTCDAQTGGGDPYLPFREIMALLTGEQGPPRLARFADGRWNTVADLPPKFERLSSPGTHSLWGVVGDQLHTWQGPGWTTTALPNDARYAQASWRSVWRRGPDDVWLIGEIKGSNSSVGQWLLFNSAGGSLPESPLGRSQVASCRGVCPTCSPASGHPSRPRTRSR